MLQGNVVAAVMKCITVGELYHGAAVSQETYATVLSSDPKKAINMGVMLTVPATAHLSHALFNSEALGPS